MSSLENMVTNLPPHSGMFIDRLLSCAQNHVTCIDELLSGRDSSPCVLAHFGRDCIHDRLNFHFFPSISGWLL